VFKGSGKIIVYGATMTRNRPKQRWSDVVMMVEH